MRRRPAPRFLRNCALAACCAFAAALLAPGAAQATEDCQIALLLSKTSDRADPIALDGQTVSGEISAFAAAAGTQQDLSETTTVLETVRFTLRRADGTGEPLVVAEQLAPFDLGRTAQHGAAISFDTATLRSGEYVLRAELAFKDETTDGCGTALHATSATFSVLNHPDCRVSAFVSASSTRADPVPLQGRTISGDAYVFLGAPTRPSRDLHESTTILETVRFTLRPSAASTFTEGLAPFDLSGTFADWTARPLRTTSMPDGVYYLYSELVFKDWTLYRCGDANRGQWTWFAVDNQPGTGV
jgi:hypothetical protein